MLLGGAYAGPQERDRFKTEAAAAARLQHPHIVQIFEVGEEKGCPYLALEYVEGGSLDQSLQGTPLPPGEAALLAQTLARAVHEAHRRGIVHRDLKPANILLQRKSEIPNPKSEKEGTGLFSDFGFRISDFDPKVADFGLAKRLDAATAHTQSGAVLGTPDFMAPEQAGGSSKEIGPAADVYALGAILYYLLTGRPPFLAATALDTLLRVRSEEPVPPSLLQPKVPRDLETVCLKCLEKGPPKRYASALDLADDLGRFLKDDPVQARPPSAAYRLGKFLRRHKGPVLAAALVFLALLGGIIGTTWGLISAQAATEEERLAKEESQKRLGQIEKTNDILTSIFENLDPEAEATAGTPLQAILGKRLDRATALLEGEATGDPLVVAKMQHRLGRTQLGLGYPAKAITLLSKARQTWEARLGPYHLDTLDCMNNLALAYRGVGKLAKALPLHEEILKRLTAKLGPNHQETLAEMGELAAAYRAAGKLARAQALQKQTFKRLTAKLGPDHPKTLASMNNLALAYLAAGKFAQGLALHEKNLQQTKAKRGPDHPNTLISMNNLAAAYQAAGKVAQAVALYKETLKRMKAKLGPDHPDTLVTMNGLASAYHAAGKLAQALPLMEETLERRKATRGPDHPETLRSMNNLGVAYQSAGKVALALPLFKETLQRMKASRGPDHPDTLTAMNHLAGAYRAAGKLAQALPLYKDTLERMQVNLGPNHPHTLATMTGLAGSYEAAGKLAQALPLHKEALKRMKAELGPDHPDTLWTAGRLAWAYQTAGNLAQALPLQEETTKRMKAKLGPDHPETLTNMNNLALAYQAAGKLPPALPLFEEAFRRMKAKLGPEHPNTLMIMSNLAGAYAAAGKFVQALPLYEQQLKRAQAKLGPDHPETLTIMNNLAAAYGRANRLERSVALFEETYRLRKAKSGENHPDTLLVLVNLGGNYMVAGRLQDAIKCLEEASGRIRRLPSERAHPLPQVYQSHFAQVTRLLTDAYQQAQQYAKAQPLLEEQLKDRRGRMPRDHPTVASAEALLALCLLGQKKYAEAEQLLRECLATRERNEPDLWTTFNTKSMLGEALAGRKKYAEAEAHLVQSYQRMKERQAKIPGPFRKVRIREALQRLVQLYDAWGNQDAAARWRKELEACAGPRSKPIP
jgi:tetratricopeptide (TPR) repeat protein